MLLHDYLYILRRGWLVVAALALVGAFAGFGLSQLTTPSFQSRATVYVASIADGSLADIQQGNTLTTQRSASYANLATTSAVLQPVAEQVGVSLDDLRPMVASAARDTTSLVDITVTADEAGTSASIANAVAESLSQEVSDLDARGADRTPVRIDLVDPAEAPSDALSPKPATNTVIGALVGLVLGIGIIIVASALDTRIRTAADLPVVPGLTTVTAIPSFKPRGRSNDRLESLRSLRANLQFGGTLEGALAVAPVSAGSNVLSLSREFASTLAEVGLRVVVVDADLRIASGTRRAAAKASPSPRRGLAEILASEEEVASVAWTTDVPNVDEVAAGRPQESSAQLLSTSRAIDVIGELVSSYDVVLVVCPPLIDRSEAAVVAALTDDCIVSVESRSTTRAALLSSLDRLAVLRVSSVSVVIDNVRDSEAAGALWRRPPVDVAR